MCNRNKQLSCFYIKLLAISLFIAFKETISNKTLKANFFGLLSYIFIFIIKKFVFEKADILQVTNYYTKLS